MGNLSYRCENEYGPDPCEAARAGRVFTDAEVSPAMDGGPPRCPAQTLSGATCGSVLVPIPAPPAGPWRRLAFLGGGAVGLAAALAGIWVLLSSPSPRLVVVSEPVEFSEDASGEAVGTLRIRNEGEGALIIRGIDPSTPDFHVSLPSDPIPPGATSAITVRYGPGAANPVEGSLSLRSNDPGSPRQVALSVKVDPWWVYKRLESTSTILNPKP